MMTTPPESCGGVLPVLRDIPDDASFGKNTFEVLSSRLQPGCAESAIVNGILTLIEGARTAR